MATLITHYLENNCLKIVLKVDLDQRFQFLGLHPKQKIRNMVRVLYLKRSSTEFIYESEMLETTYMSNRKGMVISVIVRGGGKAT